MRVARLLAVVLRVSNGQTVGNLTVISSGTLTSALPLRIAGSLVIELIASDYTPATSLWDNRATSGAVSTSNGDFGVMTFGTVTNNPPLLQTIQAMPAVSFPAGGTRSLSTLSTPTGQVGSAHFNWMYGGGAWTTEAVIMPLNFDDGRSGEVGQESPYFQWGPRGAPACTSGFLSLGHHPIWGAAGAFDCDISYNQGNGLEMVISGQTSGYRPIPNVWHHVVVSYSGGVGPWSVFVDGQQVSSLAGRSISTTRMANIHIGSWFSTGGAGMTAASAIHSFRFHTGALSADDVAFNWGQVQYALALAAGGGSGPAVTSAWSLSTLGYQTAKLDIAGFGASVAGAVVTYSGPNPASPGQRIIYPAGIDRPRSNSSVLIITTTPGVGSDLVFNVSVPGVGWALSRGAIAAYAFPTITGISGGRVQSSVAGGTSFVVTGTSFGPLSLPGYGAYIPTVTYGGDQGANFTATSCTRAAATAHTAITCRTSPGAGSGWVPRVCVGGTGQCSAPPTATLAIDYPAPNITGLFGALIMNTAGGERLVATGFNLGTPVTTGLYPVSLQWGPPGGTFPYSGSQCTLERVSQASSNMQLSCNTVAGRGGAGLVARIRIGNSVSNVLAGTGLRFAPPVIQTLEGPGALDGPTTGLAEVNITGSNFGWDSSALSVTYTYRLTGPIPGVTTVIPGGQGLNAFAPNNVTYRPPVCVIAVNHTVITCLTAAGSGSGMEWRVVVAGQTNANPTSSYAAPVITGYQILERLTNADITAVGAAAGGNSTIVVQGTGFGPATAAPGGPIPLLQAVYLVSPAGVKTLLATSSYSLQSDASLRVRLPPGSGGGWAMSVRVADRDSTSPTGASWQYALPVVQAVDCGGGSARAPTAGGVTCTVTGANFPLDDPAAQMVVLFGNPADGSLLSSALRAAPVYSALSRIMPNTVTFALPPGAGVARAVRLTSYRSGESVPNPAAFTASPAPQTQNCLPGVACTGVDVVTYSDPTLAMLVVTRPTVQAQWDLANAVFGSASASTVRVVTILGSGFGPAPGTIAGVNPEAIVRDVHLLVSSQWVPLSLTWSVATPAPFAIDSASLAPSWTDSRIVLLTNLVNATIRLALTSQSWDGSPIAQLSNILSYVDLNPAVVVTIPGPYPTTGRDLATGLPVSVPFTVQHLDWSSQGSLNVTVGGQPCPLVAADGVTVVPPSSYQSAILTNPAFYSPSGVNVSIGPDTVWSFRCLLPAGQGINQNLIVTRLPDGRSSSTAAGVSGISASSVIYSSPSILTMSVDGTAPITVAGSSVRTRIDPSGGSIISLTGINFGVCPSVTFAAATLYYCGSGCACTPQQLAASENVTRNDAHTQITFTAPAGEGDGVAQTGSADGWTLTVSAGGQSARTDVIKVGYLGPVITSVESLATGAQPHFPTRGGVRIRINGRGFGVTATGTGILPPPALRVYIGNGTFVDPDVPSGGSGGDTGVIALCNVTSGPPWNRTTTQVPCPTPPPSAAALTWWSCGSPTRVSQVVIECSLPEGAGASLAAVVIVAGQVGRSAGPVLSYNPPVIRTLSSSLADSGATRCGGVNSVPSFIPATNVAGELRGPTTGGFRVNISGSDFGLRTGANGSCVFVPWQFRPIGEGAPRLRCDGFESWAGEGEIYGPLVETWTHESIVFCMPHGLGALDVAVFSAGQFSALRDAPANASDPSSAPGPTFAYIEPQITGTNPNSGGVLGGTFTTISGQNFGVGLASLTGYGGGGGGNNNVPNIQLPYPLPLPSNWQPQHLKGLQIVWGGGCIAVQPTGNASAALGAGACPRGRITAQTHNQIVFITPPGSGAFTVGVRVLDGDRVFMATVAANNETQWAYDMPELASLSIVNGSTTGGAFMAVSGNNLQNPGAGQGMRINWGPQPRSVSSLTPGGMCAATTPQIPGTLQCANNTVTPSTFGQNAGRRVTFFSLPGVGRNINVSLSLIDEDGNVFTSNVLPSWSYNPPRLTGFTPNPILVGDESPTILATGTEFGSEAVIAAYRAAGAGDLLTSLSVSFNDDPSMICAGTVPSRIVLAYDSDDTPTVQFCLNRTAARVGYHNASVFAAGQQGTLYDAEEGAMMVGCKPGYFGWPGENCVPCPPGAKCDGYVSDIRFALEGTRDLLTAQAAAMRLRVDARMGGIHWYPRPLEGYFNLNSSDANYPEGAFGASRQAAQCPPSAVIRGRDVCIVACLPAEACLGDNVCAVGYKSKAPLFRCATCDTGYYKRNGECIKCPDSPIALVIGFLLLVIVGAGCAYVLQKKNINIAYISIGGEFGCQR